MLKFFWRSIKVPIKVILFLLASILIGLVPGYICMVALSFICWIFGIIITKTLGDIILFILVLALGVKITAEMIGKI